MGQVVEGIASQSTAATWEELSKARIALWSTKLAELTAPSDIPALQALKSQIEIQTALAELRIKARQADKAWLFAWSPLLLPSVGAVLGIIGTLATLWVSHYFKLQP